MRPWTSALVLLAAVLLWPSIGLGASGGFLFSAGDGSCYDVEPLVDHSAPSSRIKSDDADESEQPCSTDGESDASSNLCFEAANSQISTLPDLLAEANGREMAEDVVDSVVERMASNDVEPPQPVAAIMTSRGPDPSGDGSKVSCTTTSEECRSLPPAPPTIEFDASTPMAERDHPPVNLDDISDDDDVRAWARLDVGPSTGYERLPDRPPQGV